MALVAFCGYDFDFLQSINHHLLPEDPQQLFGWWGADPAPWDLWHKVQGEINTKRFVTWENRLQIATSSCTTTSSAFFLQRKTWGQLEDNDYGVISIFWEYPITFRAKLDFKEKLTWIQWWRFFKQLINSGSMTSFALEMPIVQIRSEIARKKVNVVQNDKFLLIHHGKIWRPIKEKSQSSSQRFDLNFYANVL